MEQCLFLIERWSHSKALKMKGNLAFYKYLLKTSYYERGNELKYLEGLETLMMSVCWVSQAPQG